MIYKLLRVIPCKLTARLVDSMLNDRVFQVVMGSDISSSRKLKNGLPQGSVFAACTLPTCQTRSRKFGYADDWVLATRCSAVGQSEETLTTDLEAVGKYFRKWRIQPNATKTEVTCFHLNNKLARRELRI